MLRPFEMSYLASEIFLPAFRRKIRQDLKEIARRCASQPNARMLDVGARKSHYTIGLPVELVLLDLPRETEIQHSLNLGATAEIRSSLERRRSNVDAYIVGDVMTADLPEASFDIISAVEVIEHVHEDEDFVRQIRRLLRKGGTFYCTTPNGTAVPNVNPDHVRHYTKDHLASLLQRHFEHVEVRHEIRMSRAWKVSQSSWTPRRPLRTLKSMAGGLVNGFENVRSPLEGAHLIAVARA